MAEEQGTQGAADDVMDDWAAALAEQAEQAAAA
ncbi:flagellar motor switch protein FliN, partial [Aquitalea sp. S1-19]|nr:flagellar motor switch protein FliN [Aquitalea sp. S1-19]